MSKKKTDISNPASLKKHAQFLSKGIVADDEYILVNLPAFMKEMEKYGTFVNGHYVPNPRIHDAMSASRARLLERVLSKISLSSRLKGFEIEALLKQRVDLLLKEDSEK